ncbi:MAG: hypothetical protein H6732_08540 [Alphaproteobacteria bacterium]|nr:hypothetical protein [Alphaproteobacteria bacterium]
MAEDKEDRLEDVLGEGDLEGTRRSRLISAFTKRLQNPRQLSGDAMELLGVVLESSDRAKTEAVKMVAREVRHYLEELKLREDLYELVTSHSLEVKMSLKLEPLAGKAPRAPASPEPDADEGASPVSPEAEDP